MKSYPLFKVHIPVKESLEKIKDVLESGFINEGIQVTELTQKMQEFFETEKLILLNSCTSALTLALKLCGIEPGDDVITTPMTCVATNTPIYTMGANIVWADVDPNSGMIDAKDVEKKITEKTKAVMAVAWAGTPPELSKLKKICSEKNVKLILDAAHAFGSKYNNSQIHSWADFTCYSFQAIKHVTTGDGGALICSSEKDYKKSKSLKWFGLDRDLAKDSKGNWKGQQWDVDILEAGYKFNMNNLTAAIGLSQFPYINNIINKHKQNAALYDGLFKNNKLLIPAKKPKHSESSSWVYTVKLKSKKNSRDELLEKLNKEGIHAGVVHVPNDNYTAFKKFKVDLPGVREFSSMQFSLPCGWWLNEDDIKHIANLTLKILENKK